MDDRRDIELTELRTRLTKAEYRVEPRAVADAIVRRRWSVAVVRLPSSPAATVRAEQRAAA